MSANVNHDCSGVITLKNRLDRENIAHYNFTVTVNDGTFQVIVPVTVSVLDFNDNSPAFNVTSYSFKLTERNYTDSYLVGSVWATDADDATTNNGEIVYSLSSEASSMFVVNASNGQIHTKAPYDFDRENMVNPIQFEVIASDLATEPHRRSARVKISISILDVNDNAPSISGAENISLSENLPAGSMVTTVSAVDADEVRRIHLYCSLLKAEHVTCT
jgi:hypothetical protein